MPFLCDWSNEKEMKNLTGQIRYVMIYLSFCLEYVITSKLSVAQLVRFLQVEYVHLGQVLDFNLGAHIFLDLF